MHLCPFVLLYLGLINSYGNYPALPYFCPMCVFLYFQQQYFENALFCKPFEVLVLSTCKSVLSVLETLGSLFNVKIKLHLTYFALQITKIQYLGQIALTQMAKNYEKLETYSNYSTAVFCLFVENQ